MSGIEEAIDEAIIGKRIIATSWAPEPCFGWLESITLEGGIRLDVSISGFSDIISVNGFGKKVDSD